MLVNILGRLGAGGTSSFSERLVAQKLVYFVQHLGAYLGYPYTWYIHGPYAPALTKDLFSLEAKEHPRPVPTAVEGVLCKLDRVLGDIKRDPRQLELLASVHFLATAYKW